VLRDGKIARAVEFPVQNGSFDIELDE